MISIIIPNLNGIERLKFLLPSIEKRDGFEVVLVDNGSTDGSASYAESMGATAIKFEKNKGFAAACNEGARVAKGDALFFLNNDTILDPRCMKILAKSIAEHKSAGFFAPKMIRMADRGIMDGAGDLVPADGRPIKRAGGMATAIPLDDAILSPCGGAALWRRELFEKLGGFDEDFFAYLEDVDLGMRAILAGATGVYVPDAVVYHLGAGTQASGSTDSPNAVRWIARNKIWLWAKCLPTSTLARHAPGLALGLMKSAAHHTFRSGRGGEFFAGTVEGLAGLPKMLARRKQIMQSKTISDREVERWIKAASRQ